MISCTLQNLNSILFAAKEKVRNLPPRRAVCLLPVLCSGKIAAWVPIFYSVPRGIPIRRQAGRIHRDLSSGAPGQIPRGVEDQSNLAVTRIAPPDTPGILPTAFVRTLPQLACCPNNSSTRSAQRVPHLYDNQ